mmetsp:Transcript_96198/g.200946  ORF Transcript_96198/g.200946 Transcript_96198/m.200946 type:complete len:423 (+) Transcript_96198:241-1509(+)
MSRSPNLQNLLLRQRRGSKTSTGSAASGMAARMKVELAATSLMGLGGVVGFHTSILVDGVEYYFNERGVVYSEELQSHSKEEVEITFMGYSEYSVDVIAFMLAPYFRAKTYDKLRKNCNSFSDCCLFLLCGQRLPSHLCRAERFGLILDGQLSGFEGILGRRNDLADSFDLEKVIASIGEFRAGGRLNLASHSQAEKGGTTSAHEAEPHSARSTSAGSTDEEDFNSFATIWAGEHRPVRRISSRHDADVVGIDFGVDCEHCDAEECGAGMDMSSFSTTCSHSRNSSGSKASSRPSELEDWSEEDLSFSEPVAEGACPTEQRRSSGKSRSGAATRPRLNGIWRVDLGDHSDSVCKDFSLGSCRQLAPFDELNFGPGPDSNITTRTIHDDDDFSARGASFAGDVASSNDLSLHGFDWHSQECGL